MFVADETNRYELTVSRTLVNVHIACCVCQYPDIHSMNCIYQSRSVLKIAQ
jgi:hypothetical protein